MPLGSIDDTAWIRDDFLNHPGGAGLVVVHGHSPVSDVEFHANRINIDTGAKHKIADLPARASIVTINADDTLGAGTFIEGEATSAGIYGAKTHTADRMGP